MIIVLLSVLAVLIEFCTLLFVAFNSTKSKSGDLNQPIFGLTHIRPNPSPEECKRSVFKSDDCFYVKVSGKYLSECNMFGCNNEFAHTYWTENKHKALKLSDKDYNLTKHLLPANHTLEQVK